VDYKLPAGATTRIPRSHSKFILAKAGSKTISEHRLKPNYPNPFNPATTIRYDVAAQVDVSVQVYNVLGQKVRTLVDEQQTPGSYSVRFDGRNLSSGMYFIQLRAGDVRRIQKMTLLK